MDRSKISRSIIVVIFIALIIFLGYFDIKSILSSEAQSLNDKLIKIGYVCILAILVGVYIGIKDKLYKMRFKRRNCLIIRYIYIGITIFVTSIFSIKQKVGETSTYFLAICLILMLINAILVKKVIFNVSKSDILSVLGLFSYAMLPIVISNEYEYINSLLLTLTVFASILNMQILIDELKQKGIKNKKYLIMAIFLGIFMGLSCIFGINTIVWCIVAIVSILITIDLDNTHINFPKKVMSSITQENREKLYSIERINISKLLICICVSLIVMFSIYFIGRILVNKISSISNYEIIHTINSNIENNKINNGVYSFTRIKDITKSFVSMSKRFYLVMFVYIVLVELLNIILKRKYDTKSTILKSLFFLIYVCISIFSINLYIVQPLFTMMLVLITLVNTSNIYLNREERVKMLVA